MKNVSKSSSGVFISYTMDARPSAEKLSDFLESRGVSTWTDFKNIRPAQRWPEEIQRALDDAQCFVLMVGPRNAIGEWQDREWQGALQRTWTDPKKRLIPVLIDDATPPSFLMDWEPVRGQSGKRDSGWIETIYQAVHETDPGRPGTPVKRGGKRGKALQSRLKKIESVARQAKSYAGSHLKTHKAGSHLKTHKER